MSDIPAASSDDVVRDSQPARVGSQSLRGGWSTTEEGLLIKILLRMNLRTGRSTTEQWQKVADELARDGQALGFPRRSASSCRHRAVKLEVYRHRREDARAGREAVPAQRSFGEVEVKHLVAGVLVRIAEELRRA